MSSTHSSTGKGQSDIPEHLAQSGGREESVLLHDLHKIVSWIAERIPLINPPPARTLVCYDDRYVEISFHGIDKGLLTRTASGSSGVAFTLGNPLEQRLAVEYVIETITHFPSYQPIVHATTHTQGTTEFGDFKIFAQQLLARHNPQLIYKNVKLAKTSVDITHLTSQSPHPDSVLAACAIAYAFQSIKLPSLGDALATDAGKPSPATRQNSMSAKTTRITEAKDLLELDINNTLLRTVSLSVKWHPSKGAKVRKVIFNLTKDSHRDRCRSVLKRFPDAEVKCHVHRSYSPNMIADITNLHTLGSALNDGFDDQNFDLEGLTFAKLVSENSCRWHWKNSCTMAEELVRRSTIAEASNYIYLVGLTGEGKSTTFNKILGLRPGVRSSDDNVGAMVGSIQSTTSSIQTGKLFPDDGIASDMSDEDKPLMVSHIIDTPGLSDDSGRDKMFINNLMDYVSFQATANLVLLIKQKAARIDESEHEAIGEYKQIFGKEFGQMLRIVCTNVQALQPTGEDTESDQVTVESVLTSAKELFNDLGVKSGVSEKVFFIGDVKELFIPGFGKYMPLREGAPDPRQEIKRLREDIRNSRPKLTASADMLRELLRDAESFWKNPANMDVITQQSRSRLWFSEFITMRNKELSNDERAVFMTSWSGPLGFFNWMTQSEVGEYDRTTMQLSFHGQTEMTKKALSKADNAIRVFPDSHEYLVAFIEEEEVVVGRTKEITRKFELIERGEELSPKQRRRVAAAVLSADASREEVRAGVHLCGDEHAKNPEVWM